MYSINFNTSILGGGDSMDTSIESFINYCNEMMIATEKGLNFFIRTRLLN